MPGISAMRAIPRSIPVSPWAFSSFRLSRTRFMISRPMRRKNVAMGLSMMASVSPIGLSICMKPMLSIFRMPLSMGEASTKVLSIFLAMPIRPCMALANTPPTAPATAAFPVPPPPLRSPARLPPAPILSFLASTPSTFLASPFSLPRSMTGVMRTLIPSSPPPPSITCLRTCPY